VTRNDDDDDNNNNNAHTEKDKAAYVHDEPYCFGALVSST
jgi:hypothetical protein